MSLASSARLLVELDPSMPPAAAVEVDEVLLEEVAAGRAPSSLRVWECGEAVVMPRRQARALAGNRLNHRACVRRSGGSAVGIGPGVVCVSLVLSLDRGRPAIDSAYRLWLGGIGVALRRYGVQIDHGEVPGAVCDGAFNAVVGGRKIAGTAQARRRGAVLVHGCLLVDVDRAEYCGAIAEVTDESTDHELLTTLREEAGREIDHHELADAVVEGFGRSVGVNIS